MSLNNPGNGFGHVPAYQASALPWVTGSLAVPHTEPTVLRFPKVTKYIKVRAAGGTADVKLGFSFNGITSGSNFYTIRKNTNIQFDLRVTEIYLLGSGSTASVDVFAGLTLIDKRDGAPYLTGSTDPGGPGAGWEGVG